MRLSLRESGVPTGLPVVLLHAFPLSAQIIPDAGHFPSVENPAAFNERLSSFLKRT
ncbi:MAG: alpha/beta hydrolase [Elusimicrobiota bacterium]